MDKNTTNMRASHVSPMAPPTTPARLPSQRAVRFARRHARALVLAGLTITAIILRLVGIGRQSLWLDEAFSVYVAAHPYSSILTFISGSDAHPPLYYFLLHTWMLLGWTPETMRMLSALASIAALLPTYLIGRRIGSWRVGALAMGLMAFSAFQVWYAQEIRMYALTTLAVLVAMLGLLKAWQEGGFRSWALFLVAMVIAMYLDYSAFYVLAAVIAWYALEARHQPRIRAPFALSMVILLLCYAPWLPAMWKQLFVYGGLPAWIGASTSAGLAPVLADLMFNRSNLLQPATGAAPLLASGFSLAVLAIALWIPRKRPAYSLLAFWVAGPLILGIIAQLLDHPILIARTMMVIEPALFLLLAMAADSAAPAHLVSSSHQVRRVVVGVLLATFVMTNLWAQSLGWTTTVKEDWRGAATYVASQQQPGDLILFADYYGEMPFDYYYNHMTSSADMVVQRGFQTQESLLYADMSPTTPGIRSTPELLGYARVWLVISHADPASRAGVTAMLSPAFRETATRQFVGITVKLYQIRDG